MYIDLSDDLKTWSSSYLFKLFTYFATFLHTCCLLTYLSKYLNPLNFYLFMFIHMGIHVARAVIYRAKCLLGVICIYIYTHVLMHVFICTYESRSEDHATDKGSRTTSRKDVTLMSPSPSWHMGLSLVFITTNAQTHMHCERRTNNWGLDGQPPEAAGIASGECLQASSRTVPSCPKPKP